MSKVTINRLQTGVPGLDQILGGGLPEFSFNLIAGKPGSGKTTLAHQLMFSMSSTKRPALYFTVLGEPALKMLRYQQQFEFFRTGEINNSIHLVNLSGEAAAGDLDQVAGRIASEVGEHGPGLVFVDSFRSVVRASSPAENKLQQFMQELGTLLTSWQATTFLVGEYAVEQDANPVVTLADGLFWLHQSVQRNSMVRKIEIMKMRAQAILPGLHTFRIDSSGIRIFPPSQEASEGVGDRARNSGRNEIATDSRIGTGLPELDKMLGGGLPTGYSVLVAGPSGSGKTILAASFLAEGARLGETGVVVVFEQNPNESRNRVVADLVRAGKVGLIDSRSPDLSIDEIVLEIMAEIKRLNASRVVIDSLSGFELSIAPTFQADFRESLARMVHALSRTGVTVLMTTELEDRYTDLRFSPYGTAFLTDAIIVQRYAEIDSRLQRLMAVVKVRGSAHSDQLRTFSIDGDGIHVGDPLPDHKGLLGGRPSRRHSAENGC
jgi:circadian clock protein KaiC